MRVTLMCKPHSLRVNVEARSDPTRTTTIRRKFESDITRRFKLLRRAIVNKLVRQDAFGLKANRGEFEFTRTSDKVDAFMTWLQKEQAIHGLQVLPGAAVAGAAEASWMSTYVQSSYVRGLNQAAARMRSEGANVSQQWVSAAFRRPIHVDRLGISYTRMFTELQGITAAMDQQIARVLAEGLGRGDGPPAIARAITNRVDKIGITRAKMLARTEVINAHAEASLNAYEEAGLESVDVEAEWLTAAGACPECEALESQGPYTIRQARGLIPVHPNCRCAWAPRVVGGSGIELR